MPYAVPILLNYKRTFEIPPEEEGGAGTPESEVKDWRLSSYVENKVESIEDPRIQDFAENFLEGFWDVFRDSVDMVYD